jgi:hypothetical protein
MAELWTGRAGRLAADRTADCLTLHRACGGDTRSRS